MFRPLRTLISLAVLALGLWAAFAVDLGGKTFAEHVDTISETPEAQQLIDGARSKINPALHEVRDRVLGEYVEAPTWIPTRDMARTTAPEPETLASTITPAAGEEPALPGRRKRAKPSPTPPATTGDAPALPGRRRAMKRPSIPKPAPTLAPVAAPEPAPAQPREAGPSERVYARD